MTHLLIYGLCKLSKITLICILSRSSLPTEYFYKSLVGTSNFCVKKTIGSASNTRNKRLE